MNKVLLLFAFALVACEKDQAINPLLVGSWERIAYSSQSGTWQTVPPVSRSVVVFTRKGAVSGYYRGCGCLIAYKYAQQGNFVDFTYGGEPCPTLIACQPDPPTEIITLTKRELILKRGQYQTRYERK